MSGVADILKTAPATNDPITWVALILVALLVVAVVGVGAWIARAGFPRLILAIGRITAAAEEDRKAASVERREQLTAFREELALERSANAAALAADRAQRTDAVREIRGEIARVHARVDDLVSSSSCDDCAALVRDRRRPGPPGG